MDVVTDIEALDSQPANRPIGFRWNTDAHWPAVCQQYERIIASIAMKLMAADSALREDIAQEARIALATVHPHKIRGYDAASHGPITANNIPGPVDAFMRQCIRNSMLSYLESYNTGDWYSGRTVKNKDGEKEHRPSPVVPLDGLLGGDEDDSGMMQIDEHGTLITQPSAMDGEDTEVRTNASCGIAWMQENADIIIDRIEVDDLLSTLDTEEQALIRRHLDGAELISAEHYRVKRAIHKLAVGQHSEKRCDVCSIVLPASRYGWTLWERAICLACETPAQRTRRGQTDIWLAAIDNGARWTCLHCQEEKAASAFPPVYRTVCAVCASANATTSGTRTGHDKACSCDLCTVKHTERAARAAQRATGGRHGTYYRYSTTKCRCDACVAANRARKRRQYQNKRTRLADAA